MTRMFVNTKIRMIKAIEAREAGQGTLEYLGIVVVVVLLVGALIAAFTQFNLGSKITRRSTRSSPPADPRTHREATVRRESVGPSGLRSVQGTDAREVGSANTYAVHDPHRKRTRETSTSHRSCCRRARSHDRSDARGRPGAGSRRARSRSTGRTCPSSPATPTTTPTTTGSPRSGASCTGYAASRAAPSSTTRSGGTGRRSSTPPMPSRCRAAPTRSCTPPTSPSSTRRG